MSDRDTNPSLEQVVGHQRELKRMVDSLNDGDGEVETPAPKPAASAQAAYDSIRGKESDKVLATISSRTFRILAAISGDGAKPDEPNVITILEAINARLADSIPVWQYRSVWAFWLLTTGALFWYVELHH